MKVQLSVEGMSCHHCSGRVQKYLESKDGISDIQVDLEGKKAAFTCPDGFDVASIVQGINDLGYKTVQQ